MKCMKKDGRRLRGIPSVKLLYAQHSFLIFDSLTAILSLSTKE